jgi:hypothetical protein
MPLLSHCAARKKKRTQVWMLNQTLRQKSQQRRVFNKWSRCRGGHFNRHDAARLNQGCPNGAPEVKESSCSRWRNFTNCVIQCVPSCHCAPSAQKSAVEPSPDSIESTPHPHTLYKMRFNIILPSASRSPNNKDNSFVSWDFLTKILYMLAVFPCVQHVRPIYSLFN